MFHFIHALYEHTHFLMNITLCFPRFILDYIFYIKLFHILMLFSEVEASLYCFLHFTRRDFTLDIYSYTPHVQPLYYRLSSFFHAIPWCFKYSFEICYHFIISYTYIILQRSRPLFRDMLSDDYIGTFIFIYIFPHFILYIYNKALQLQLHILYSDIICTLDNSYFLLFF